jgi:hypothetical protein
MGTSSGSARQVKDGVGVGSALGQHVDSAVRSTTRSTVRRWASCPTSAMTDKAPATGSTTDAGWRRRTAACHHPGACPWRGWRPGGCGTGVRALRGGAGRRRRLGPEHPAGQGRRAGAMCDDRSAAGQTLTVAGWGAATARLGIRNPVRCGVHRSRSAPRLTTGEVLARARSAVGVGLACRWRSGCREWCHRRRARRHEAIPEHLCMRPRHADACRETPHCSQGRDCARFG